MRRDDPWVCPQCDEFWPQARMKDVDLCQNCAGTNSSKPLAKCPICLRKNVPGQFHHTALRRQHPTLGRDLCLNCHAILTSWQETKWDDTCWKAQHPVRCILRGDFDLMVLWVRRNPGAASLWELARFWFQSLLALLDVSKFGRLAFE